MPGVLGKLTASFSRTRQRMLTKEKTAIFISESELNFYR